MSIDVKEIAFTGYPVRDFEKARAFYSGLLGLKESMVMEEDGEIHWIEYDIGGATLALAKAGDHWQPHPDGGGVALEVEDIHTTVEFLKKHGIAAETGISDFPGCCLTVIHDPDGNGIALHQRKPHHPDFCK